jgi:anti-sigma factor RsiW
MSDHVMEWLGPYWDGELHGSRLEQVEAHLAECEICQRELEALENITGWLQEAPTAEFTSPERFAAQVSLRLPHSKPAPSRRNVLEVGWWMIPVGLLAVWGFVATTFLVNDLLSLANNVGLLSSGSDWLWPDASAVASWSIRLARAGILSGRSLDLAISTESFTRTALPQIALQMAIALVYLSWVATWWARHRRRLAGGLIEG